MGIIVITGCECRDITRSVLIAGFLQSKLFGLNFSIVGELETLDRSSALLADVPDNVGDGVGLVLQMTIGNINDAHLAISPAISEPLAEAVFHSRSHVIAIVAQLHGARRTRPA